MWYTILITLAVDVGGLLLIYGLLRDRVRRATSAHAQIAEIREEVSRLLVELNQTTDRNILLLEDRVGHLNDLLAAADKKLGILQREIERHDVGARIYGRIARPAAMPGTRMDAAISAAGAGTEAPAATRAPEPLTPLAVELSPAAPQRVAAAPRERPPALPRTGARPGPAAESAPERDDEPRKRGDVQQRVLMLHRSGFSAALIAGRVGAPVGEVELIIALEERRQAAELAPDRQRGGS